MARRTWDDDEPDFVGEGEQQIDPEGPDPSEMDPSDEPDIIACPRCRKAISEDAERCHHCGEWVIDQGEALNRPMWTVFLIVLLLLTVTGIGWLLASMWHR